MKAGLYALALTFCLGGATSHAVTLDMVGDSFSVNFNGIIDGTVQSGLSAFADFQVSDRQVAGTGSEEKTTWTLDVSLSNTSSTPVTGSRVSALGFNVDPDFQSGNVSGLFNTVDTDSNSSQGTIVEACFLNDPSPDSGGSPNCAGGNNGGVDQSASAPGVFVVSLMFEGNIAELFLDNFRVRYQSIDFGNNEDDSGIGIGTVIPLPAAAWLFLTGLAGLFGFSRLKRAAA